MLGLLLLGLMAGRIPRQFIDDIIARTDIVDFIDARVPLKKAGRNHQACCPFHNEKSPSFTVSADKQFYHCFGCGAHGNVLSFLMEYDQLEFVEAVEELAALHHLDVPREQQAHAADNKPYVSHEQKKSDYELMGQVSKFFRHQLKHHSESQVAIDYLKKRGLTGDTVLRFQIGYASSEWDGLTKQFGKSSATLQQLDDLKVISQKGARHFDFFRERIMFPIRDKRGRVIGFGGRVLSSEQSPKYLNSPETRIFHKGKELYGLYEALQANNDKLARVLVVEGYMDVVALSQSGISYAVAALGTATTGDHMHTLFRTVSSVVCCYDGDRAGRDAAWRALENALPYLKDGAELSFVFLPDGEDPDSLVQKEGQAAFEQRLDQAQPFVQTFFDYLQQGKELAKDAGKAALMAEALPLIDKVASEYYRENLVSRLAQLIGRTPEQLAKHLAKPQQKPLGQQKVKMTPMRRAIALLLQHPALAQQIPYSPELRAMPIAGLEQFLELQQLILQQSDPKTGQLVEHYRDSPLFKTMQTLASWDHQVDDDKLEHEIQAIFSYIEDECLRQRAEMLLLKAKNGEATDQERKEYTLLLQALQQKKQKTL